MHIHQIDRNRDLFDYFVKHYINNHSFHDIDNHNIAILCPNNQSREEIITRLIFAANGGIILPQIFTLYDIKDEFIMSLDEVDLNIFYKNSISEVVESKFLYEFLTKNLTDQAELVAINQIMKLFIEADNKLKKNFVKDFSKKIFETDLSELPMNEAKLIKLFFRFQKEFSLYKERLILQDPMELYIQKIFLLAEKFKGKIYLIANITEDFLSAKILKKFMENENCEIFIHNIGKIDYFTDIIGYVPEKVYPRSMLIEQLFSPDPLDLKYSPDILKKELENFTIIEPDNDIDETNIILKVIADELTKNPLASINVIASNTLQGIGLVESLAKYGIYPQNSFKKNVNLSNKFSFIKIIFTLFISNDFKQELIYELLTSRFCSFSNNQELSHNLKKLFPMHHVQSVISFISFFQEKGMDIIGDKIKEIKELQKQITKSNFSNNIKVLVKIVETLNLDAKENIWSGDDGRSLSKKLNEIITSSLVTDIPESNILDFFEVLMEDSLFSSQAEKIHYNITILSPLEARMKVSDILIILGFYEGNWPAEFVQSKILPAKVASKLKISGKEMFQTIQQFYFTSHICSKKVILSAPKSSANNKTDQSRFLTRIKLLASYLKANIVNSEIIDTYNKFFISELFDQIMPFYNPPLARRPKEFSVTELESYIKDPLNLYYNKILGLKDYGEISEELQKRDLGILVHGLIERIVNEKTDPRQIIDNVLKPYKNKVQILAQINYIIEWVVEYFQANNEHMFCAEKLFSFELNGSKIKVRPDLIEYFENKVRIFDFKTGTPPNNRETLQLQLAAFATEKAVEDMSFISKGKKLENVKISKLKPEKKEQNLQDLINQAVDRVEELIGRIKTQSFTTEKGEKLYGKFRHLARVT